VIDVLIDMTALSTCNRERGIGRYVRSLCTELASRENWLDPAMPGAKLDLAGLVRHYGRLAGAVDPTLRFGGDPTRPVSGLRDQRHKLERRLMMGSLLQAVDCRLAHLPDPPGTPFDRRRRRIVTCHDLIPLVMADEYLSPLPGSWLLQRERDKARYQTAARVIAISEATRRDLIERLGIAPERIDVVHHGVDHARYNQQAALDERAQLTEKFGISGEYLFYLGAGDARKNLPLLVRAYAQSGIASDVKLLLAGPISEKQRARLSLIASKTGVAERVQLVGFVPEALVPALYRQCLAHVFPSSYEGFGLTVLEAMACGAPTLTTALSSLGEVAGDAALTLTELRIEPFAEALKHLASDSELRADLRRRGAAHARGFTWQRCAAQTLGCYQRALDEEAA
jgi:glycosyltransferase involved in cell wall biosynthesis